MPYFELEYLAPVAVSISTNLHVEGLPPVQFVLTLPNHSRVSHEWHSWPGTMIAKSVYFPGQASISARISRERPSSLQWLVGMDILKSAVTLTRDSPVVCLNLIRQTSLIG